MSGLALAPLAHPSVYRIAHAMSAVADITSRHNPTATFPSGHITLTAHFIDITGKAVNGRYSNRHSCLEEITAFVSKKKILQDSETIFFPTAGTLPHIHSSCEELSLLLCILEHRATDALSENRNLSRDTKIRKRILTLAKDILPPNGVARSSVRIFMQKATPQSVDF